MRGHRGFGLALGGIALVAAAAWAATVGLCLGEEAAAPKSVPAAPAAAPTPAPAALVRPTGRTPNCTAGDCHAKEKQFKFLHGPAAVGACDVCHAYADEKKHTFQLRRAEKDLCNFCHVGMQIGKSVHKPVQEGQCLSCHNPHGSEDRQMLRAKNMGALCASCHADVTKGRKEVHGPVAAGNCATCHNAHSSDHPRLLVAEGRALCLGCHKDMAQQLQTVKNIHKPAEGECLQCHEPHASNQKMQLKAPPLDLCLSCHAQVKKAAEEFPFKHSAITQGQACLNCHTPHGSDLARLMKRDPVASCLTCHNKAITKANGSVVASMAEVAQPGFDKHGPIRDGNCSGCHTLHGGQLPRLLTKPYPETFYQPFKAEAYALCFGCHDQQLVLAAQTEGLTRFRNGSTNLHFVHVNKPEKGRTCYACHNTHASRNPAHIRESVPFGNWEIPIRFQVTPTGGACEPGCHRTAVYDRVKAATPPIAAPTTPTPPAATPPITPPPATTPPPSTPPPNPPPTPGATPAPAPAPPPSTPETNKEKSK